MGNIDIIKKDIIKKYLNLYEYDQSFQEYFLYKRIMTYRKIVSIIEDLGVNSVLDIGCSYGLLVEEANAKGIDRCLGIRPPYSKFAKVS